LRQIKINVFSLLLRLWHTVAYISHNVLRTKKLHNLFVKVLTE